MNGIGITASKKVGKSVRRNRLKRLVRESYRSFEPNLRSGCQFVFVLRPLSADAKQAPKQSPKASSADAGPSPMGAANAKTSRAGGAGRAAVGADGGADTRSVAGAPTYADICDDVRSLLARAGAFARYGEAGV